MAGSSPRHSCDRGFRIQGSDAVPSGRRPNRHGRVAAGMPDRRRRQDDHRRTQRGSTQGLWLLDGAIVAIGNAPTALLETARLVKEAGARPALVIGVPVGFVSAAESKEAALRMPTPYIVARGRKGGSTIAVAVIHALLLLSTEVSA